MNLNFRLRFAILITAIGAVSGLTVWAVWSSGRHVEELQRRLTVAHLSTFRTARDFQRHLLTLNNMRLQFEARHEPTDWKAFEEASAQLDIWIEEVKQNLSTARERRLVEKLSQEYDSYLALAKTVKETDATVRVDKPSSAAVELERQADELLELGNELAVAHGEAREAFLGSANRQLGQLRSLLYGTVGLSLVLEAALGWLLYRDLIAPIRTRLVRSEALLERQEKLATLGTLAAGIAHEIRNPLTSIKARLFTMGKHIRGNHLATLDADIIHGEISRLERIVQEVLQFARPSEPKIKSVAAHQVLSEVTNLIAGTVDRSRVELLVEAPPNLWICVDPPLIQQVLLNLVRNAIESISNRGTVTMTARSGSAEIEGAERDAVIIEVIDTGTGIPPEIEERLFDPFFTTKDTGTGLGLSIALRIVERHKGLLQYHTQPGRGTKFAIVLPKAEPPGHYAKKLQDPLNSRSSPDDRNRGLKAI